MKTHFKILSTIISLLILITSTAMGETNFGAKGARQDQSLNLAEMLNYAIEDEYLARAEYSYIMSKQGSIRPFSNIIKAENQHINMLIPLFKANNLPIPSDKSSTHIIEPKTLKESFEAAVKAEIENIEMYELFLKQNLPSDVKSIFERLRNASQKHLKAFRKALSRY